jgi:glycosyltransferase involved in cell wall biosynthesis
VPTPSIDNYSKDFRKKLGLKKNALFILQPTRVIQRKGIEMAIELVHRLNLPDPVLFISHRSDDEGLSYWHWLKREAYAMNVNVNLIDHLAGSERTHRNGHKYYSLADAYLNADLVTYPSLYEGFGNALLEAVYYKRLTVVNCYPVYNADIKPLGFEFIELDGFVNDISVESVCELINDQEHVKSITEKNFEIAREHFSLEILEKKLTETLNQF